MSIMSQNAQLFLLIGVVAWILSLFVGFSLRPLLRAVGSIIIAIGIFLTFFVTWLVMFVGLVFIVLITWVLYRLLASLFGHHRRP